MHRDSKRKANHKAQQLEIRRTANVARCLQEMAPQVSAYIRLSNPPVRIPANVRLDASSTWSRSALLCTAVETVTLPNRLREGSGRSAPLTEFEGFLNTTGSRTIFDLKASILTRDRQGGDQFEKPSHGTSKLDENQSFVSINPATTYDIDYSPRASRTTLGSTPHVFSQIEIWRCITPDVARASVSADFNGTAGQDTVAEV